jgi:hypothetical protein
MCDFVVRCSQVSFFTIFNGVTLGFLTFVLFCGFMYWAGPRTELLKADAARRRRFKTQCLSVFIWAVFLIYPQARCRVHGLRLCCVCAFHRSVLTSLAQVNSTTLLIFACTKLEDGTSWLQADYRIQCWTPLHMTHVGAGAVFTLLFPFGIPVAILYFLRRARVPELARWKRDCAWLRAIVQRALVMGVKLPEGALDPDTVTTESISLEHLRTLHRLFVIGHGHGVGDSFAGAAGVDEAPGAHLLLQPGGQEQQQQQQQKPAHKPRAPAQEREPRTTMGSSRSSWTRMRGLFAFAMSAGAREAGATERERRLSALSRRSSMARGRTSTAAGKSFSRKSSFVAFFWSTERALLLGQLLDWAKSDKRSVIGEPRHTQLRWRTHAEWQALAQDNARLGPRDTAERAAFFKYRFLFADYAVRAWYWCAWRAARAYRVRTFGAACVRRPGRTLTQCHDACHNRTGRRSTCFKSCSSPRCCPSSRRTPPSRSSAPSCLRSHSCC